MRGLRATLSKFLRPPMSGQPGAEEPVDSTVLLAEALDDEARYFQSQRMSEHGAIQTDVSQAMSEASQLADHVRKLQPSDPRRNTIDVCMKAGRVKPLSSEARAVLAKPWPDGFDADAKLDALLEALGADQKSDVS